jgi:4-hydroxy-3-polyprenylbenzoate decarboxylase
LVHARNVVSVIEAGAHVMPAMPSFYSRPETFDELADTVVHRILDQLGLPVPQARRWKVEPE